jgi:amidohydrolase
MNAADLKQRAAQEIDAQASSLKAISLDIYAHPEVGYEEQYAARLLADELEKAGFAVQRGAAGLDTAFIGRAAGTAGGPRVAILAEYDSLPGLGHACGHNLIAATSLGAALGLKAVLGAVQGSLVFVGGPAEEKVGGKIPLVEAGLFSDVDAAMMIHPRGESQLGRLNLATSIMEFVFHGRSSHAGAAPEKGINALDACIALFNGTNALKKHLRDDARLHGVILEGGNAANIVPDRARAAFSVRAKDRAYLQTVMAKTRACAEAGALMAGATVDVSMTPICAEMKYNLALSAAFGRNAAALGHDFLPVDLTVGGGSTDMGNVSQVVPAIHPFLKIGDSSLTPHTVEFRAASCTDQALQAMLDGAKMLAMTAIDLWTDPELLRQARDEFRATQQAR